MKFDFSLADQHTMTRRRLVRDGEIVRVPTYMMDVQRSPDMVAMHDATEDALNDVFDGAEHAIVDAAPMPDRPKLLTLLGQARSGNLGMTANAIDGLNAMARGYAGRAQMATGVEKTAWTSAADRVSGAIAALSRKPASVGDAYDVRIALPDNSRGPMTDAAIAHDEMSARLSNGWRA